MGMLTGGALSTLVLADKSFLIPVPHTWTLEEAASIPVVYGTVLYALLFVSACHSLPYKQNFRVFVILESKYQAWTKYFDSCW